MSAAALTAAPNLAQRLGLIFDGLRRELAFRAARDRALAALVLLLWNRLSRTLARFTAITLRHRAGTLRTRPQTRPRANAPPPPPRDPLPRERGWLVRRVQGCAAHGEYLRLLLADPETEALIEAAPQLRRLLRPLWRMLRTDKMPDVLRTSPLPPAAPLRAALRRPRRNAPRPQPHDKPRTAFLPAGRPPNRA